MDQKQKEYQVIITQTAQAKYYTILDYVYDNYSKKRADEISFELLEVPDQLTTFPDKGAIEQNLNHRSEEYKFILYKRTDNATIKVIYYIDYSTQKVYVTDFFPTEMDHLKINKRS
jgi:hypothetical protein